MTYYVTSIPVKLRMFPGEPRDLGSMVQLDVRMPRVPCVGEYIHLGKEHSGTPGLVGHWRVTDVTYWVGRDACQAVTLLLERKP